MGTHSHEPPWGAQTEWVGWVGTPPAAAVIPWEDLMGSQPVKVGVHPLQLSCAHPVLA